MSIKEDGKKLYNETRRIIREAKDRNRLVLFVGAGASADSGMPLWSDAVKRIAERISMTEIDATNDALKIPQYYYNSRGKKEYTQLMRDIFLFNKPLKTTELHKKLIECQAETIITTNYDHLLEQAAEENAEVRYIISKDSDIPYKNSPREIVKMHGDFENDNFVLKEDDYLNYSKNFRLIETYVKSIIGSRVVLFVGYSLNDPDVKQIFAWVKDVLKDDFQRAYLVLADGERNEIQKDYYRNLGVNIIYVSELLEDKENASRMERLVEFFDYILKDEKKNELDSIYDEIKPLQDLNYVYGKYINNVLDNHHIQHNGTVIDLSNFMRPQEDGDEQFKELLWTHLYNNKKIDDQKLLEVDLEKLNTIKAVLDKSIFNQIDRRDNKKLMTIEVSNDKKNQILDLISEFDYHGLCELREVNEKKLSYDAPDLYMQQAYICALLNDHYASYLCLRSASRIYYKNRDYTWYAIAEINRKYVGKVCGSIGVKSTLTEEEWSQLDAEVKAINIDKMLNTIPNLGHRNNKYLRDLGSFDITYTLFQDMYLDAIKVGEQAKTEYLMFAGKSAVDKLRENVIDYNNYTASNYIIMDRYMEVRSIYLLYIRTVLTSVFAREIPAPSSKNENKFVGNVRQEMLSKFDIYIMLRYLEKSDFEKLVKEFDINLLPVDDEASEYIEDIADSIMEANKYKKNILFNNDIFWMYLKLLSHTEISDNLTSKVLMHIGNVKQPINIRTNKDVINKFIVNLCRKDFLASSEIIGNVKRIIDKIIDYILADPSMQLHFVGLLCNCLFLSDKSGNAYDDKSKVKNAVVTCGKMFCVKIFPYLGNKTKKTIKESFAKWTPQNTTEEYCIYCEAVKNGVLRFNHGIEKQMYTWIKEQQLTLEEQAVIANEFPHNEGTTDVIDHLINLYLYGIIKDATELLELSELARDNMSIWLLDIENFDYDMFDCNWLSECGSILLQNISRSEIARKGILKAYQQQYDSKPMLDNVNDIIVKYFIVDPEE